MEKQLDYLFELVKNNKIEELKVLLQENPAIIEKSDQDGVVAIYIASEYGHYELVKHIIEYTRTSMNIWDKHHRSALHYAAKGNDRDLFKYLVDRVSLNPIEVDMDLKTPLDYAIECGSENIVKYYNDELNIDKLYKNPVMSGSFPDP